MFQILEDEVDEQKRARWEDLGHKVKIKGCFSSNLNETNINKFYMAKGRPEKYNRITQQQKFMLRRLITKENLSIK